MPQTRTIKLSRSSAQKKAQKKAQSHLRACLKIEEILTRKTTRNTSSIFKDLPLEIKERVADYACKQPKSHHEDLMREIREFRVLSRWYSLQDEINTGDFDDRTYDIDDVDTLEELMTRVVAQYKGVLWGIDPLNVKDIRKYGIDYPQTNRCPLCGEPTFMGCVNEACLLPGGVLGPPLSDDDED